MKIQYVLLQQKPVQQNTKQSLFMNWQDSGDQFQTLNDQLLTYSFSSHIPSTSFSSQRRIKKIQQRPILNIIQPTKSSNNNYLSPKGNKAKKGSYTNGGKVIRIGNCFFKSNFQCGNLGEIQMKGSNTYKITMDKQTNSNRISAWFYFRCEGLKGQINFIINGFTKSSSLYNQGMKVCYRQIKDNKEWKRGCSRISYTTSYTNQSDSEQYQLKFTYLFKSNEQCPVQFAYCFPYQYSRVFCLTKSLVKNYGVLYESLGKSYEGRDIPLLTIGNPQASKSIVLSARVHPGQTVASFIMEGFLKQLVSQSQFAKSLREKYLFKIVPMINPDGVVRGNYRFSAAGYDLNRRWKHCYETSHPQIYYLKNMIKKLNKQKKVIMYLDIHGHSRKKNVFFYGCCGKNQDQQNMSKPKQFPYLMQKIDNNFKYDYCTFSMSKDKQGTARIAMWKQLKIDHVYTLQSTLCGSLNGGNYFQEDYFKIGESLLEGISIYFYQKPSKSSRKTMTGSQSLSQGLPNQEESIFQKMLNMKEEAKQQLKSSPYLLNLGMNDSDSGSDSQPQAGFIPEEQRQIKSTTLKLQVPLSQEQKKIKEKKKLSYKLPQNNQQSSKNSIKINIRSTPTRKKNRITPQQMKSIVDEKINDIKQQQLLTTQKKVIAKTVTNFYSYNSQHLDSLTTDALSKRNQRVHSKNINKSVLQKYRNPRINSENHAIELFKENNDESQKQKIQNMNRNLLKTREGAQYRRVKLIAQEMKRKANSFTHQIQPPTPIVRGIATVNNELQLNKKKVKSIAPSFYPQSQQKNRRFSVQVSYKNRSGKIPLQLVNRKLYINGDDISVHCKGTKIYI